VLPHLGDTGSPPNLVSRNRFASMAATHESIEHYEGYVALFKIPQVVLYPCLPGLPFKPPDGLQKPLLRLGSGEALIGLLARHTCRSGAVIPIPPARHHEGRGYSDYAHHQQSRQCLDRNRELTWLGWWRLSNHRGRHGYGGGARWRSRARLWE